MAEKATVNEEEDVKNIEEYDGPIEKEIVSTKESEPAKNDNESQADLKKKSPSGASEIAKTAYKTLKDFLILGERTKEIDNMDKAALLELVNDLTAWRNKIASDGSGHNYPEQLMEMDVMFDKIETAIKERDQ